MKFIDVAMSNKSKFINVWILPGHYLLTKQPQNVKKNIIDVAEITTSIISYVA
jgi:hypothetical protein